MLKAFSSFHLVLFSSFLAFANCEVAIKSQISSADAFFSYGLESEINVFENPQIVQIYRLSEYSEAQWLSMPTSQRLSLAQAKEKEERYSYHKPIYTRLSRTSKDLPDTLETEGNGNVELNGDVFSSFSQFRAGRQSRYNQVGQGSLQSHLVYKLDGPVSSKGSAGYTVFAADHAQLLSLEISFAKFLQKPDKTVPGKSLVNYSLGPIGKKDLALYRENEKLAERGLPLQNLGSSRLIYGSILRTDAYPEGHIGWEMRQFHKRGQQIEDYTLELRDVLANADGVKAFKEFENVEVIHEHLPTQRSQEYGIPINSSQWASFFGKVRELVRKDPDFALFEHKDGGGAPVYQRFYYPLRPWLQHPLILRLPEAERTAVQAKIRTATENYLNRINAKVVAQKEEPLSKENLQELQILASQWAFEAGLSSLFQKYWQQTVQKARGQAEAIFEVSRHDLLRNLDNKYSMKLTYEGKIPQLTASPEWNNSFVYKELRDTSIELITRHLGELGYDYDHTRLRVGDRMYEITIDEGRTEKPLAIALDFKVLAGDRTGFLFSASKESIREFQKIMEKVIIAENSERLPPFIVENPHPIEVKVIGQKAILGDHSYDLIQVGDSLYMKTVNGVIWPVKKVGERYVTETVSCTSGLLYYMSNYFGIKIPMQNGYEADARSVYQHLNNGNPGGNPVEVIIEYLPL